MQIFQKTVLKEFVALQNLDEIKNAFDKFQAHFANKNIQDNIKNAKEEEYQEGFLQDLFVNILGYTLKPQPNFNLVLEQKTQNYAKKSDGAILKNGKVIGVIELKSMKTILLEDIQKQAFEYKNSHIDCKYVITSNFKKLRFYLENNVEYEDFDLFDLSFEHFSVLYSVLHCRSILNDKPIKLKKESTEREEKLTLEFYNDYQSFKEALFFDIVDKNIDKNEYDLLNVTQILLDRIIFICFAKDKGLLPANYIKLIIEEWERRIEEGENISLFDRFKTHFEFINTGFKSKKYDIFGYNGGLFSADNFLYNLKISDNILQLQTKYISRYDFDSDIDVNILGNIFEHSLNQQNAFKLVEQAKDLRKGSLKLNETGQIITQDKKEIQENKRKKDGIFYTPKFVTKYMIEDTLGMMCANKKNELSWDNITLKKIITYQNWLKNLKILDPACGSGAFLNQILTFLIDENDQINRLKCNFEEKPYYPVNISEILENNIYGVDINKDSIGITKLSLSLKNAQMRQKLNELSDNIKIGNSLIADKNIDEKAFDWSKEFIKIAKKNKNKKDVFFDLIIGNPPYGAFFDTNSKKYLQKYDELTPDFESYYYFITKGIELLKDDGIITYIIPNTFLSNQFAQKFRENLINHYTILSLTDLSLLDIFNEAKVRTCIFNIQKQHNLSQQTKVSIYDFDKKNIQIERILDKNYLQTNLQNWLTLFTNSSETDNLITKIRKNAVDLNKYCEVSQGYIPYRRTDLVKNFGEKEGNEIVDKRLWHTNEKLSEEYKNEILGKDLQRYYYKKRNLFIKYGKHVASYVHTKFFVSPRILIREIAEKILTCTYITEEFFTSSSIISVIDRNSSLDLKYIVAILNSKLIGWFHYNTSPKAKKGLFPKILIVDVRKLPIVEVDKNSQQIFIDKVEQILSLKNDFEKNKKDVFDILQSYFKNTNLNKKIENWVQLDWNMFLTELTKSKIDMSIKDQIKWKNFFNEEQPKIKSIAEKIQNLEKEIDNLVYELYNLTKKEIQLIENE